jgi:hypothetical protein
MSSNRERVAAAIAAAKATGKSVDEVLTALAPTWGVNAIELAQLKHNAANVVPGRTTAEVLTAQIAAQGATKLAVQRQAQADAAALVAFRDYEALKAKNPHAASARLNEDADAIFRGRELAAAATPDPEPPQAA